MARRVHLLLLSLLALALGAFVPGAAVAAPVVTIAPSGGGAPRSIDLAGVARDVQDATYTLRAADRSTAEIHVAAGTSLAELLRAAGLEDDAFAYAVVDGEALLSAERLAGTEEGPPVVWADEDGVHFLRPLDDARDVNAEDLLTPDGDALTIELLRKAPVKPQIAASRLRARAGERIAFDASLAVGTLRRGMRFQWYFDDGEIATGAHVEHRFARHGAYVVLLNVVRGSDGVGLPGRATVRIVRPRAHDEGGLQPAGDDRAPGSGGGADETAGSGAGTGASAGTGGTGGAGTARPRRPKPRVVVPPPIASRDPIVSGTLLASADVGPVFRPSGARATMPAAAVAEPDRPLSIPVGVWIALGVAVLLTLGWAIESRYTPPFWQP